MKNAEMINRFKNDAMICEIFLLKSMMTLRKVAERTKKFNKKKQR